MASTIVQAQSWSLTGNGATNPSINFVGTKNNQPLIFRTNKVERMRITEAGNIAIGTTTPSGLLVAKSTTTWAIEGSALNSVGVFGHSQNGTGVEGYSGNYNGVFGYTNSSWYAGYFQGNIYCNGSYLGSDQSLKQNIHDFSGAIDVINKLHPKQYQFRQDGNYALMKLPQGNHYGLIAQDVEKILPNLVKDAKFETRHAWSNGEASDTERSETISFKALNYTELIPIVIKGVQEQQVVIQKQQAIIEEQKAITEKQQQQIDELKQMITTLTSKTNISSLGSSSLSSKQYLKQNMPNPFSKNTVIQYYIPEDIHHAELIIYNMAGSQLKSFTLNNSGLNEVTINGSTLPTGQYIYSLFIDGKKADSKNMIRIK